MTLRNRGAIGFLVLVGLTAIGRGQGPSPDWPQWRGPTRDGVVAAAAAPAVWPERLTRKWKVEVGLGYATPILVGNRIYMYTRRGENEVLAAIDPDTGKEVWQSSYPAPFTMNPAAAAHGPGPKSTPAFADNRIFTLGMSGIVTALDAASGKRLWQKPASPVGPLYGTAMSPLVDRGLVIVHVGGHDKGALTAFDPGTGAVKWSWNGDGPAYSSPIAADLAGTRQIITFTQDNLIGVAAATGELLWKRPYTTSFQQNAITPLIHGQTVIVSGLEKGITAFSVSKQGATWSTQNVWENPELSLYMSNGVLVRDALCGLSHRSRGQFFCLDAKTGKTLWKTTGREAENAAAVRSGDLLVLLTNAGELIVARNGAGGLEPVRRYTVADAATWAEPVVAGNRLFIKDVSTLALWTW
jgi:outer membrane protein assembly factor BamB